jgi:hypothetical protein
MIQRAHPADVAGAVFLCPFCGVAAFAIGDPPLVGHKMPMCEKFKELDALEYVTAARRALESEVQ